MESRSPLARSGIALLVVAGLLTLLAVAGTASLALADRLRAVSAVAADRSQTRLAALSGIAYGSARLFADGAPATPPNRDNQVDDWTYRDGPGVPLDRAVNPSYAQTEPYRDIAGDGRFDGADSYIDLDGNGRFDVRSSRLRGMQGSGSATFTLKVLSEGGKIPVNQGILDAGDRNGNGIPDHRDLGIGLFSGPDLFYKSNSRHLFDIVTHRNRRIADLASTLSTVLRSTVPGRALLDPEAYLDVRSSGVGKAIVEGRPWGGYRRLSELETRLPPEEWQRLQDFLTPGAEARAVFGIAARTPPAPYLWEPETRALVRLAVAPLPLLHAMQVGLCWDPYWTNACVSPVEAERIAALLVERRPFGGWYALHQALENRRAGLFIKKDLMPEDTSYSMVDAVAINASPENDGVRAGTAYMPPFSWKSYDLTRPDPARDAMADANQDSRKRRGPFRGIAHKEFYVRSGISRRYTGQPAPSGNQLSAYYGTLECDLAPASQGGSYSLESLGRSLQRGAKATSCVFDGTVSTSAAVRARSQADFENLGDTFLPDRTALRGRPVKDRIQSYPMFSLDSMPDFAHEPGWTYTPFAGDLRLMDLSGIRRAGERFYVPAWEAGQPLREPAVPNGYAENFRDAAGGLSWTPERRTLGHDDVFQGGKDVLATGRTYQWGPFPHIPDSDAGSSWAHGPAAQPWGHYVWEDHRFPLLDASGAASVGAVQVWSAGSYVKQMNPLRSAFQICASPTGVWVAYCDWYQMVHSADARQDEQRAFFNPSGPLIERLQTSRPGGVALNDWYQSTLVWEESRVTIYAEGIVVGTGDYQANGIDPAWETALVTGLGSNLSYGQDELRLYSEAPIPQVIAAHAGEPRYWTPLAAGLEGAPSFISPLYVFPRATPITGAGWDGYVPKRVRDAVLDSGLEPGDPGKAPLQVELLLHGMPDGSDPPRTLVLPEGFWPSGGGFAELPPLRCASFRYRVRMDVSALEGFNNETPVFDALSVWYRRARLSDLSER